MRRVALDEISEQIDYGITASAKSKPVGPKFLRITDIQNGAVDWETVPYCESDDRKLRQSRLQIGDIVFARTGATTGKSFLIRHCPEDAVFASYLIRVRPSERVDSSFLAHFFDTPNYWDQISLKSAGAAQPGVNASKLQELEVPLPPLPEQRRIAAILDQADALRAKRREALAKLDEMAQAIFVEMFGDPVVNSKNLPLARLGDLGTLDRGVSKHRPRNAPELLGGRYPFIQTGDVSNSDGYIRNFRATYSETGFRQSKMWPAGTLCITIAANIARVGILDFDACFPDSIVGFHSSELETTEYVRVWFGFVQQQLEQSAPESTQKNINLAILRSLPIPVPPLGERSNFALRIRQIGTLNERFRNASIGSENLFYSLQHRAFSGDL